MFRIIFLNSCGELIKDSKIYASCNEARREANATILSDSDYKDFYIMSLKSQMAFKRQPLWVVPEIIKNLARNGHNYRVVKVEQTIAYIEPCCK